MLRLRIDDDEDAAGDQRAEDGDHTGKRVVGEHDDPVAAFEAELLERLREASSRVEQLRVGEPLAVDEERRLLGLGVGGGSEAVVEEAALAHG